MALSARQMLNLPPSTATPSNSTLIIIDAQNEYAQGALRVTNASSTRKVISQLLELYRSASSSSATRIVHVLHQVPDGAPIFTPGTDLAEEFEELKPQEGEKVVKKLHPSAFAETELDGLLKKDGVEGKKVVLVGYMVYVSPFFFTFLLLFFPKTNLHISNIGTRLRLDDCSRRRSFGI